jgi:hypothetical protein
MTYVPGTDGVSSVTKSFAETLATELLVEATSAEKFPDPATTTALVVSITDSVASFAAPAGNDVMPDVTVTVSDVFCAKNPTVMTAVADSPAITVSAIASMVNVSAFTAALVGSADSTPKDIAAASPKAIFLNEFTYFSLLY